MNILKTKDRVIQYLSMFPHLRDDDNKLLATFWVNEIGGKLEAQKLTAENFLKMLALGALSNSESIRRMRQKVQEECEYLRGPNYVARKSKEAKVKRDLKK